MGRCGRDGEEGFLGGGSFGTCKVMTGACFPLLQFFLRFFFFFSITHYVI